MLSEEIQKLNQKKKEALTQRMQLEVIKYKLDNLLTSNLFRHLDELIQALQEIAVEDRKRKFLNCKTEVLSTEKKIKKVYQDLEEIGKR